MTVETAREYYALTELKRNGWTDKLIAEFLPIPDKTKANPYYKCAAPMKLYSRERVDAVERTDAWIRARQASKVRQAVATKGVQTKKQRLLAYVDGLEIQVDVIPMDRLIRMACASYNDFHEGCDMVRERCSDWDRATPQSDQLFLERITVNYLRHECSSYDDELVRMFGLTGIRDAYRALNTKDYAAIGAAYPSLRSECERQEAMKFETAN